MAKNKPAKSSTARDRAVVKLRSVPTGVATDALTRLGLYGWMDGVLPISPKGRVAGLAVTLRHAPRRGVDQSARNIYELIRTFEPGSVLVIEAGGTRTSVLGGNMATQAQVQGLAGMITDGHCRDFPEMAALKMPVFCMGRTVRLPHELELVAHNLPITCGGAQVRPGDFVIGDADGVVVIPGGEIEAVLYQAEDIARVEKELGNAIKAKTPMATINDILKRKKTKRK